MTTRDELITILEEQRKRRRYTDRPVSPTLQKKKSRILMVTGLIFLMLGTAIFFRLISTEENQPITRPVSSLTESVSEISTTTRVSVTIPAELIQMQVCTDIPNGRLQVHFDPGAGSEIRGYLRESETVEVSAHREVFGGLWLQLVSPVAGWANGRLLCPKGR
jgi:hypothetical protein